MRVETILRSKLAPWQRIDAIKCFVFPLMRFHMRCGTFGKKKWEGIDRILRAELKKTLNVPQEASNEYLYGSVKEGLCGLPRRAT